MSDPIPPRPTPYTMVPASRFIDHEHGVAKCAVEALRVIANADHAEDGGPTCDHNDIAQAAIDAIEASGWKP